MSRVPTTMAENVNGPWWKNKKNSWRKINSEPTLSHRHFERGWGRLKKHIGHLLYYTQEVSNQIMLLTSYMKW